MEPDDDRSDREVGVREVSARPHVCRGCGYEFRPEMISRWRRLCPGCSVTTPPPPAPQASQTATAQPVKEKRTNGKRGGK